MLLLVLGSSALRDGLALPPLRGRLLAVDCVFTRQRVWLFSACERRGVIHRRCDVIGEDGRLLASAQSGAGDEAPPWLTAIGGHCSAGEQVFAPTDDGVVRLERSGDRVIQTRSFPDTAPYVDAATRLVTTRAGLFAAKGRVITRLERRS